MRADERRSIYEKVAWPILGAFVVLFLFNELNVRRSRVETLTRRAEHREQGLVLLEEDLEVAKANKQKAAGIEQALCEAEARVPTLDDVPTFLRSLDALAVRSDLDLLEITVVDERFASAPSLTGFTHLILSTQVRGTYRGLRRFMALAERGVDRVRFAVRKVDFAGSEPRVVATFTLGTWVRTQRGVARR